MVKGMRDEIPDDVRKGLRQFGIVTGGIEGPRKNMEKPI